jgi:hypothetical protein
MVGGWTDGGLNELELPCICPLWGKSLNLLYHTACTMNDITMSP